VFAAFLQIGVRIQRQLSFRIVSVVTTDTAFLEDRSDLLDVVRRNFVCGACSQTANTRGDGSGQEQNRSSRAGPGKIVMLAHSETHAFSSLRVSAETVPQFTDKDNLSSLGNTVSRPSSTRHHFGVSIS
jgi:hypothetical protein